MQSLIKVSKCGVIKVAIKQLRQQTAAKALGESNNICKCS